MSQRSTQQVSPVLLLIVAIGWGFASAPVRAQGELDRATLAASLPDPVLSGLETAVAEQLAEMRQLLIHQITETETPLRLLGEQIGELGRLYLAYDLLQPAEQCYRIAEDLAPGDARWPYLAGILQQRQGQLDAAARSYERALSITPRVVPTLVRLGRVYAGLDRPEAAEWLFREALLADPACAAAEAALGELLVGRERYLEAEELLRSALARQPGADSLYLPLASALNGIGADRAAQVMKGKAGSVDVHLADPLIDDFADMTLGVRVHLLRGRSAYQSGRFDEAAAQFRQALALDSQSVAAHLNLGAALERLEDDDAALEQYRRAAAIAPEDETARFSLGSTLAERGDLEAALEHLEAAVQLAPSDEAARLRLAEALRRSGRLEEAVVHFRQAADLDPPGEIARFREAQILSGLGRYAQARERLEEGYALAPRSGVLALTLARLLASAPDLELRDGRRAVEILDSAPIRRSLRTYETLAMAHAEVGECEKAVNWQSQAWETALDADDQSLAEELEAMVEHYETAQPCRYPGKTVGKAGDSPD